MTELREMVRRALANAAENGYDLAETDEAEAIDHIWMPAIIEAVEGNSIIARSIHGDFGREGIDHIELQRSAHGRTWRHG